MRLGARAATTAGFRDGRDVASEANFLRGDVGDGEATLFCTICTTEKPMAPAIANANWETSSGTITHITAAINKPKLVASFGVAKSFNPEDTEFNVEAMTGKCMKVILVG